MNTFSFSRFSFCESISLTSFIILSLLIRLILLISSSSLFLFLAAMSCFSNQLSSTGMGLPPLPIKYSYLLSLQNTHNNIILIQTVLIDRDFTWKLKKTTLITIKNTYLQI